jgi:8-oxo-dGTP diphosphatase
MREHPIPVVVIVVVKESKLLLGKRKNKEEYGLYGFPGGKVDKGETVLQAVIRELKEETGLLLNMNGRPIDMGWRDVMIHDHFIEFFFLVNKFKGKVCLKEPDKCMGWEFFSINNLPHESEHTAGLALFQHTILPYWKNVLGE